MHTKLQYTYFFKILSPNKLHTDYLNPECGAPTISIIDHTTTDPLSINNALSLRLTKPHYSAIPNHQAQAD